MKSDIKAGGILTAKIIRNGNVIAEQTKHNGLIGGLWQSLSSNGTGINMTFFYAQSGTPPEYGRALTGTWSYDGTNVIRETGTDDFSSTVEEGDLIRFADGSIVVLDDSAVSASSISAHPDEITPTVLAQAATYYRCGMTGTSTDIAANRLFQSSQVGTTYETTENTSSKTIVSRTVVASTSPISAAYAGTITYFIVGTDDALVVLDSPLVVAENDIVQLEYRYELDISGLVNPAYIASDILNYPKKYDVVSATSDGTNLDVTLDDDHYYEVGDEILLAGLTPPQSEITSISSNGATISVNAVGHGFSVSDEITISGTSNYEGTSYVVASVVDADNFTIASALNVATETEGIVYEDVPAAFYNGTHTVIAVPASDQLRFATALNTLNGESGVASVPSANFNFYVYYGIGSLPALPQSQNAWTRYRAGVTADTPNDPITTTHPGGGFVGAESTLGSGGENSVWDKRSGIFSTNIFIDSSVDANRFNYLYLTYNSGNFRVLLHFDHPQTKPTLSELDIELKIRNIPNLE